jgi:glycosyltransferase involved in cell wall biosynthesis
MRILMVSPYPPQRDGIANYAAQSVAALMREGHEVVVLSPQPSAAHQHLDFMAGPRAWAAMARRVRGFDKLIVQWHPAFFYRGISAADRSAIDVAMAAVFRLVPEVEILVHEYEYEEVKRSAARRRSARLAFSQVDRIVFHSEKERTLFLETVPVGIDRTIVVEHGQAFRPRTSMTREQARTSLEIAEDEYVFLCIGFIQRHKGFDRAVRALGMLDAPTLRLDIVGSTRLEEPEFLAHLSELEWLASNDQRVQLHTGYVSDELFDRWILASDVVVLPYREIWSSGVLERAALFDRPVIATRVGGLEEQAANRRVTFVDDDAELMRAMADAAGVPVTGTTVEEAGDVEHLSWEELQDTVVRRAAVMRGGLRRAGGAAPATQKARRSRDGDIATQAATMVRRLPPYTTPPATSARPGVPLVKRLIQRLTMWEITPLASRVDQLQSATANSLLVVAEEVEELKEALASATRTAPPADGTTEQTATDRPG